MTVLTLVRSELRRLTSTRLGVLAFVALMFVPLLYGGLYLWGNQDPYGNLKHVPAGLVVADTGTTVDGKAVNYGRSVADSLERGNEFDWVELSATAAANEVRNGGVDFVVTLPGSFSRDLASVTDTSPERAQVRLATNDANSYLSSTIAGQAATAIRASVAEQVGTSAAKQFLVGLSTVRGKLTDASSGASTLASGARDAASGATTLASGTRTLASGASSAASGAGSADTGAAQLATGASSAASGAKSLAAGTKDVASGADTLADGLDSLRSATSGLPAQAEALASGAKQVAAGTTSVRSGATDVASGASRLASGAGALSTGASTLASGTESLSSGLEEIDAGSDATASALAAQLRADGLSDAQVQRALAVLAPGAAAVHSAATSSDQLVSGGRTLASSAAQLSSGADTVSSGASSLSSGAGSLASGASQVSAGAAKLDASAPALARGIANADSGARDLATGASKTAAGASSLASGTSTLSSGASTLASGLDSLRTGTAQLATGASSAASGASSLASGTASLASGAKQLSTGLASGVRSIPATSAAERSRQATAIGDPATVATTKVTNAGTYGAGLAPFFLSLSAWIGSYALFLILRPLSRRAITAVRQPVRVALAGWLTPALLGVLQMVALFFIATGVLGFSVVHPLGMIGVLALTAVTFASILLLLNAALGSVGQFLGLILMLVQLVTAGGTFPWQTLPGPLAALHHALPMAYAVDGLRQVMYGGDLTLALGDVGVLAIWLVAALSLTAAVAARMTRRRTLRDLQPSLLGG